MKEIVKDLACFNFMDMPKKQRDWLIERTVFRLLILFEEVHQEAVEELKKKVEGIFEEVKQLRLERDYWKQKL